MKKGLALVLLLIATVVAAQTPVPNLNGIYRWGQLQQSGKNFIIRGDRLWNGVGKVLPDGKVWILWQEIETSKHALSLYTFKDGTFTGSWGWADRVDVKGGKLEREYRDDEDDIYPDIEEDEFGRAFAVTLAAPVPQKRDGEKAIPDLSGECTWGIVTQSRDSLAIVGSGNWQAEGTIRPDGKVELSWTNLSSGRLATGMYEWNGKDLIGRYGYVDAEVLEDGTQPTFQEIIRITPIQPVVPDF